LISSIVSGAALSTSTIGLAFRATSKSDTDISAAGYAPRTCVGSVVSPTAVVHNPSKPGGDVLNFSRDFSGGLKTRGDFYKNRLSSIEDWIISSTVLLFASFIAF